jgi:hypothetical protein
MAEVPADADLDLGGIRDALISRGRPWDTQVVDHTPEVTAPGTLLVTLTMDAGDETQQQAHDLVAQTIADTLHLPKAAVSVELVYTEGP